MCDVKRLWSIRQGLLLLDFEDESCTSTKTLLQQCLFHLVFLRVEEVIFFSFLFFLSLTNVNRIVTGKLIIIIKRNKYNYLKKGTVYTTFFPAYFSSEFCKSLFPINYVLYCLTAINTILGPQIFELSFWDASSIYRRSS